MSSAIIAGFILLYLSLKLSALYFFVFLTGLVVYLIGKKSKESPANKKFLITLVILIFVSRFILSLFVFHARGANLMQDEGLYSKKSLVIAYQMKGVEDAENQFMEYFLDRDMRPSTYGLNGYSYILSRFYFFFGYQIQAARLINVFLNIIMFLLIFYLARELFDSNVARISSCVFAFFPSIMFWSVAIGVDMFVLLGITACMFSLVKIMKKAGPKWILMMIVSLLMVASVRSYIAQLLFTAFLTAVFLKKFTRMRLKGKLIILITGFSLFAVLLHSPAMPFLEKKWEERMTVFLRRQKNLAQIDDSGYYIYPPRCYREETCGPIDLARAYGRGMYYAVFSPFPWRVDSKLQLMAYPQVMVWYLMIPFILYGFYAGFKINRFETTFIFLYSFFIFSLFALLEGNMGALFRHRDMVTPFLIIYFAGGINKLTGNRE